MVFPWYYQGPGQAVCGHALAQRDHHRCARLLRLEVRRALGAGRAGRGKRLSRESWDHGKIMGWVKAIIEAIAYYDTHVYINVVIHRDLRR